MADERIGLIGPGRMGLAMVRHLIAAGYPVTVTDIDERRLEDAARAGAATDNVIVAVGDDDETRPTGPARAACRQRRDGLSSLDPASRDRRATWRRRTYAD